MLETNGTNSSIDFVKFMTVRHYSSKKRFLDKLKQSHSIYEGDVLIDLTMLRKSDAIRCANEALQICHSSPRTRYLPCHQSASAKIDRIVSIVINRVIGCKGDSTKPRER